MLTEFQADFELKGVDEKDFTPSNYVGAVRFIGQSLTLLSGALHRER